MHVPLAQIGRRRPRLEAFETSWHDAGPVRWARTIFTHRNVPGDSLLVLHPIPISPSGLVALAPSSGRHTRNTERGHWLGATSLGSFRTQNRFPGPAGRHTPGSGPPDPLSYTVRSRRKRPWPFPFSSLFSRPLPFFLSVTSPGMCCAVNRFQVCRAPTVVPITVSPAREHHGRSEKSIEEALRSPAEGQPIAEADTREGTGDIDGAARHSIVDKIPAEPTSLSLRLRLSPLGAAFARRPLASVQRAPARLGLRKLAADLALRACKPARLWAGSSKPSPSSADPTPAGTGLLPLALPSIVATDKAGELL